MDQGMGTANNKTNRSIPRVRSFILLQVLFVFCHLNIFAQSASDSLPSKTFRNKPAFGFNYHLQISHLDIAPIVVIPIHKRVEMGFGVNYLYHYRNSIRLGKSSIGANIFSRVYVNRNIYSHVEYLYSDVAYLNKLVYEYTRVRKADVFLGAGYRQPVSDKIFAYLTVLVNVNQLPESPYKNLILFKAGLTF